MISSYFLALLSLAGMTISLRAAWEFLLWFAEVATRVLAAEAQGLVMPVQRRIDRNEWLYIAIRTHGPLRTAHSHKPSASSARSLAHV